MSTFTAADVAALADLIRPHLADAFDPALTDEQNLECAVALAASRERADFERRIGMTWKFAAIIADRTYDEFRAEVA